MTSPPRPLIVRLRNWVGDVTLGVPTLQRLADHGYALQLGRRINAVCFPYSFSSALDFRLAGLRALGHAYEGRSLLLARAAPRPAGVHELEVYWDLGNVLLGQAAPPPATIGLRVGEAHRAQAAALRSAQGIEPGCIVICPFAGGTWAQQDKTWPAFAESWRKACRPSAAASSSAPGRARKTSPATISPARACCRV